MNLWYRFSFALYTHAVLVSTKGPDKLYAQNCFQLFQNLLSLVTDTVVFGAKEKGSPFPEALIFLVGDTGLEPVTSCMSSMRSNQLS